MFNDIKNFDNEKLAKRLGWIKIGLGVTIILLLLQLVFIVFYSMENEPIGSYIIWSVLLGLILIYEIFEIRAVKTEINRRASISQNPTQV